MGPYLEQLLLFIFLLVKVERVAILVILKVLVCIIVELLVDTALETTANVTALADIVVLERLALGRWPADLALVVHNVPLHALGAVFDVR